MTISHLFVLQCLAPPLPFIFSANDLFHWENRVTRETCKFPPSHQPSNKHGFPCTLPSLLILHDLYPRPVLFMVSKFQPLYWITPISTKTYIIYLILRAKNKHSLIPIDLSIYLPLHFSTTFKTSAQFSLSPVHYRKRHWSTLPVIPFNPVKCSQNEGLKVRMIICSRV